MSEARKRRRVVIDEKRRATIKRYFERGGSMQSAAKKFGHATSTLALIRDGYQPHRGVAQPGGATKVEYIPTPAEIRAACREIQKTWTPRDFWVRKVQKCQIEYERIDTIICYNMSRSGRTGRAFFTQQG